MGLKKQLIFVTALLAILSCTQEVLEERTEDLLAVVPAEEMASKASIGNDGAFTWTDGDQIAVWYASATYHFSQYYNARLVFGAGSGTATFRVEKNGERTGYAFYPANIGDNTYPGLDGIHKLRIVLPEEYEIFDGMPSPQPMLAENHAGQDLAFYHLASLLRINLSNIPAGTRAIRVSSDADLAGPYRVTFPSGVGGHPYVETKECTNPDSHCSVLFTYAQTLSIAESRVLDVPVPQGVYTWFRVEALADDKATVLSAASAAMETAFLRSTKHVLSFDLAGGTSRLASFALADVTQDLLPGQSFPVNVAIRQVRAGGGTENASGYTLEAVGVSDPAVVELFVRDNIVRVRGLAPGKSTIRVKATKGEDSLIAETQVLVVSVDGVNVCTGRGEVFTDWYLIIPAQVVSGSKEVTSEELFSFEWRLLPGGTPLARLDGSGSTVTLRSGSATGTVTVQCTAKSKANPSIVLTGQSDVSLVEAVGIMKSAFSISATQQVYFAKANLLQDNSTEALSLCPDQLYAYHGVENLTLPPRTARQRDIFDNEVCSWFSSPYTSRPIFIGSEETIGWEVLSKAETDYLFGSRTTAAGRASRIGKLANARYIMAEVDGREGVMIFPDIFVWPQELPAPERVNAAVAPSTNKYTRAEWDKYLDAAGAVFLVGGMFGPITASSGSSMRFDYNNICYRTKDYGYYYFPLYTGATKFNYNSTIPQYHDEYRYMRVRPVKRIYR